MKKLTPLVLALLLLLTACGKESPNTSSGQGGSGTDNSLGNAMEEGKDALENMVDEGRDKLEDMADDGKDALEDMADNGRADSGSDGHLNTPR